MADQNKVLIRLVYGADHSLSKDSQEYELAEEIRRDEREECAKFVDHILKEGGGTYGDAIRARETT